MENQSQTQWISAESSVIGMEFREFNLRCLPTVTGNKCSKQRGIFVNVDKN